MIQTITTGLTAVAASFNGAANASESGGQFVLEDFFVGRTVAEAKFTAINGVKRHFRIDITGVWENDTLSLHEEFSFEDGETDTKIWYFEKKAKGRYIASRSDLLRPVEATIRNNTLRYTYSLYLDPENRKNVVLFRDRITVVDNRTLQNTAVVHKFGIPVGLVRGTFVKQD
ncbi:MAG: DUF3833 family protein [Pseudomonadota bacterium]